MTITVISLGSSDCSVPDTRRITSDISTYYLCWTLSNQADSTELKQCIWILYMLYSMRNATIWIILDPRFIFPSASQATSTFRHRFGSASTSTMTTSMLTCRSSQLRSACLWSLVSRCPVPTAPCVPIRQQTIHSTRTD
jgi:hypothetical protein